MSNVHHYGQIRIEEKNGWFHAYHGEKRLTDKGQVSLERAYQWCRDNHPDLTVEVHRKQERMGWEQEDYINYYAGGQP